MGVNLAMSVIRIVDAAEAQSTILRRKRWEEQEMPLQIQDGIERIFGERLPPAEAVSRILADVRTHGDAALRKWSARIDGKSGDPDGRLDIPRAAWQVAYERLSKAERAALDTAAQRIEAFHRRQPVDSWIDAGPEGTLGQLVRPIERVGVYVPGGNAPLPSSLLMAAIPARVAGVGEIIVCTPGRRQTQRSAEPGERDGSYGTQTARGEVRRHRQGSATENWGGQPASGGEGPSTTDTIRGAELGPSGAAGKGASGQQAAATPQRDLSGLPGVADWILGCAYRAGVDRVFALGGAQAIAALAYGTQSVPAVDKIVGAGGLFVTLAKRQVVGSVGIDGLFGPTETLLIADEHANPAWAAADLLAQAEHDVLASPLLLTPSRRLAEAVAVQVASQLEGLSRAEIAAAALANRGGLVITVDLAQAIELADAYAPEHLCLLVADPWSLVGKIRNAGGIFVGEFSFEVLGDYIAGPSHIMPTEGSAAADASALSVVDFVKRISLIALGPESGTRLASQAATLAWANT